ncbi:MarR family transcriptional regulator [Kaistia dalseonensis]|uniref:MarR family winged helix-turn-helix transcriptional regulator n=1 Tax=Kaistia dalseonensis TaxID=410840 RepID=UPI00225442AA|nr:MarR family transcriptional regulator [Kaistia dalseonensis]MCX5495635.1 MarR family transcriptional regulator [Kaistia dalseonensis]
MQSLGEIGLNNFAPYLMNRVMAHWNAGLAADMRAMGVTTPKMRALAVLSMFSSLTVNELAVYGVTEQSTMSRTIDALEEQGYIQRQSRPDDMRIRDITITPEGRAVFDRIWPTMYGHLGEMFADVTDEEQRFFVAILQKVLRNIRSEEP